MKSDQNIIKYMRNKINKNYLNINSVEKQEYKNK